MKSTVLALAAVVSMANAIITFKEPWSQSPAWKAGDKAMISWISDAQDVDKPCFIEMLTGDATNAKVVAAATDPKNPVKCGKQQLEVNHLNDFASGTYWLRIGQKDQNVWYYSGVFKFDGKGSYDTKPIRMQDGTMSFPPLSGPSSNGNDKKSSPESASPQSPSGHPQATQRAGDSHAAHDDTPQDDKKMSAAVATQWQPMAVLAIAGAAVVAWL